MDSMPYPKWIEKMPDGDSKIREQNRFRIKLAALYASPRGTLRELAGLIDVHYETLKSQVQSIRCLASEETKEGIDYILGPAFVPPDRPPEMDMRLKPNRASRKSWPDITPATK